MKPAGWVVMAAFALAGSAAAHAHVGSPDVYAEGQAGPYRLNVVIRPPQVIPGVTDVEVRSETPGIAGIEITPVPLTGEASKHPPVPDAMTPAAGDAQTYTGHLWIMRTGSWQIRFAVRGANGPGELSIPFPATALSTRKMEPGMGAALAVLGLLLVAGMVGIVGAGATEAKLKAGMAVPQANRRRGYAAMAISLALLVAVVVLGNAWWKAEAAGYSEYVYKPLVMKAALEPGNVLALNLSDPGWLEFRKLDDFIPDHDHLMHLYMIRWPQMDLVYHLHPDPVTTGQFQLNLPSIPAGEYRLYADVVHSQGFPETLVGSVTLPAIAGRALAGDDAAGKDAPLSAAGPAHGDQRFELSDGYTMVWKAPARLAANTPYDFRFVLLDAQGQPARDMALYMGMLGHAAFIKTDGTVFAHIHPNGTMAMAAFMMANADGGGMKTGPEGGSMPGMNMANADSGLPNAVSFPYGFPSAGRYRIFVQMKHGATVETGVFDAVCGAPE